MASREINNPDNPSAPNSELHCSHDFAWCEHSRNFATLMEELKIRDEEARQFSYNKDLRTADPEGTPILGRQTWSDVENYLCANVPPSYHKHFWDSYNYTSDAQRCPTPHEYPPSMATSSPNRYYILSSPDPMVYISSLPGNTLSSIEPMEWELPHMIKQIGQPMNSSNEYSPLSYLEHQHRAPEFSTSASSEPRGYKVIEGSDSSPELRDSWRLSKTLPAPLRPCSFCRTNGESSSVYGAHTLRDRRGAVVCPILRRHKCELCQATGDNAHTLTYCPILVNANRGKHMVATTVALKSSRVKSNGQRRNM